MTYWLEILRKPTDFVPNPQPELIECSSREDRDAKYTLFRKRADIESVRPVQPE